MVRIFAIIPALLATILDFMDQQITVVIINWKEHLLKVLLRLYFYVRKIHFNQIICMIFAERQRLPFGPFDCGCHDCSLFSLGNAMGRSFNSTFFEYRQIFDFGVFKCFTWRKASPRYVPNTYAFPFRHFPLHGCIFLEWPSDVGSFMFLLYARELPT